jgi:hypothetical protein
MTINESHLSKEDECVPETTEEQAKMLQEAWTLLPRLFDIWDTDESGELDKTELLTGVEQFCEIAGLDFDSRCVASTFSEVDHNNDRVLDRREFSVFISRFADSVGVPLDAFAYIAAEQLADVAMYPDSIPQQEPQPTKTPTWRRNSTCSTEQVHAKVQRSKNWAELKYTSETIHSSTPSSWETLRLGLAMRNFRSAEVEGKSSATIDLWFSIQQALLKKKQAEADAAKAASSAVTKASTISPRLGFLATLEAVRRKGEMTLKKTGTIPERNFDTKRRPSCGGSRWGRFSVDNGSHDSTSLSQLTVADESEYGEQTLLSVSQLENFQPYEYEMESVEARPYTYRYDVDVQL